MKSSGFQWYDSVPEMLKNLTRDTEWREYRLEKAYYDALTATAWTWANLIKMRLTAPAGSGVSREAAGEAYVRATLALVQMPLEYGPSGSAKRFDRSRWRESRVIPGEDGGLHCEHPWSKRETKRILWECGSAALERGARPEDLIPPFAGILDARQGTVLLHTSRVSDLGILSESAGDGLHGRYGEALQHGRITLFHRGTGSTVTPELALQIDEAASAAVREAVAGLKKLWR